MKKLIFILIAFICCSDSAFSQMPSQVNPNEKFYDALEWRHIGPFRGGRSCAVTGVPNKPLLYYFGATGGGVWKTMDGGQSYTNISDGYFGGSIGAVSVSESDPNVIYVGGGEENSAWKCFIWLWCLENRKWRKVLGANGSKKQ